MIMSHIVNTVKTALPPPPQAQPSVAEAMKPVPETETQAPVPPPAKGAEPGLGEHLDLYDTETAPEPQPHPEDKAKQVIPNNAPTREVQAEIVRAQSEKVDKTDKAEKEKEKTKARLDLLGKESDLPETANELLQHQLPFLKPLGRLPPLGGSIDALI